MKILPKILCIERPKKEEHPEDEATEVLTDVFHVPSDIDKFTDYGSKRFSQDYGIAGKYFFAGTIPNWSFILSQRCDSVKFLTDNSYLPFSLFLSRSPM